MGAFKREFSASEPTHVSSPILIMNYKAPVRVFCWSLHYISSTQETWFPNVMGIFQLLSLESINMNILKQNLLE